MSEQVIKTMSMLERISLAAKTSRFTYAELKLVWHVVVHGREDEFKPHSNQLIQKANELMADYYQEHNKTIPKPEVFCTYIRTYASTNDIIIPDEVISSDKLVSPFS